MYDLASPLFDVRYLKLYFTLRMRYDCTLFPNKASAIRGGMGEMLVRENCIRPYSRPCDRGAAYCDFYDKCTVQRTMYSHFIDLFLVCLGKNRFS